MIKLGTGRIYFGERFLGHAQGVVEVGGYRAEIRIPEADVQRIRIMAVCGYDPQRLLPYRPETIAEWASRQGWHSGGVFTGRWTGRILDHEHVIPRDRIPHLYPGDEIKMMPYDEIDYGPLEERAFSLMRPRKPTFLHHYTMGATTFREAMERNARFEPLLRQQQALLEATVQQRIFSAVLSLYVESPRRAERISRLITSRDPRQRKRGNRLRKAARIVEPHKSLTAFWKNTLDEPYEPRESLAAFWNKNLGEPYDPARYRKD